MKKVVTTSDVTSWTFSVYACMDCDPCETLLSDMRILTQLFINARAAIVRTILYLIPVASFQGLKEMKYLIKRMFFRLIHFHTKSTGPPSIPVPTK